jgi:multidrug efflux pump subunit AcrA (membrane-fusion protein)
MTENPLPAGPPDTAVDAPAARTAQRRRWPWIAGALVLVTLVSGGVAATRVNWAALTAQPASTASTPNTETAPVERHAVAAQEQVKGTLGYAGDYQVLNQAGGTVTQAPNVGDLLAQGDVLYRIDDVPIILLNGTTPAWRELGTWGQSGADVRQLNRALVALGYADGLDLDPASDEMSWATSAAIQNLQEDHGLAETGSLVLGSVVFLPGPLRVTTVPGAAGSSAGSGQPVITATSTKPQVTANIPVTLAPRVAADDAVTVSMPDLSTAEGTVRSVGTVATAADSGTATVPVLIDLAEPDAAAGLDKAPVLVGITTDTVDDALVVPVTALMAIANGKYAVEVVDGDDTELIEVELGLFDAAGGVVQITGDGVEKGQKVVVPGS